MNILYFSFYNIRFGRGTSEEEAKKILTGEDAENMLWRNFKYRVFEIPKHGGTYAECYSLLGKDFSLFLLIVFLISIYLREIFRRNELPIHHNSTQTSVRRG